MRRIMCVLPAILLVACATTASPTANTGQTPQPNPTEPSLDATPANADWGPLAVGGVGLGDDVSVGGTIRVTDQCVLLDIDAREALLVWPVDATDWDAGTRSITYTNRDDGVPQMFGDGNRLLFWGRMSTRTDGQTNEEWVASVAWSSPPITQCLRDDRLFVEEVQIPQ